MTTERDLLMAAILAHPDEDTPRLAYADEIEGTDPERAAYIRWHVLGPGEHHPGGEPFSVSPSLEWVPPWPRHTRREGADRVEYLGGDGLVAMLIFHRGFVGELWLSLAAFHRHAGELFRVHPITRVVLTDKWAWQEERQEALRPEDRSYCWWDETPYRVSEDGPDDPGNIPTPLFEVMWERNPADRCVDDTGFGRWLRWDDPDIPPEELSAACVAHGRALAGL